MSVMSRPIMRGDHAMVSGPHPTVRANVARQVVAQPWRQEVGLQGRSTTMVAPPPLSRLWYALRMQSSSQSRFPSMAAVAVLSGGIATGVKRAHGATGRRRPVAMWATAVSEVPVGVASASSSSSTSPPSMGTGPVASSSTSAAQPTEHASVLGSSLDLPRSKALGIELRASSALAVPISTRDGTLLGEPFRIRHELNGNPKQNAATLHASMQEAVKHFNWKGVAGCSFTVEVAKRLGEFSEGGESSAMEMAVGNILSRQLRSRLPFVHTMLHTTAAAYTELVWGHVAEVESWKGKVMLACTLGKNVGGVLFSDGRRVRHKSWFEPTIAEAGLEEAFCGTGSFDALSVNGDIFKAWMEKVDSIVLERLQSQTTLDSVVVLPTGSMLQFPAPMLENFLPKSMQAAAARGCSVTVASQMEACVARGAALAAVVELQTEQMMQAFQPVLNGSSSLQALSEAQIRAVFDKLDPDANGISLQEMQQGLQLLGIQRDVESLYAEFGNGGGHDANISMEAFVQWWWAHVRSARSITITSAAAWDHMLHRPPPPGFGDLMVLAVSFTFCRVCKRFEPKFQRLAEVFPEVRFVRLIGNGTVGAAELTSELGVKEAPAFFVYRRGGEMLTSWKGPNVEEFQKNLRAVIESVSVAADA